MRSPLAGIWAFVCFVVAASVLTLGLTACQTSAKTDTGTSASTTAPPTESSSDSKQAMAKTESTSATDAAPTESAAPAPVAETASEPTPTKNTGVSPENAVKVNLQLVIELQKASSEQPSKKPSYTAALTRLIELYDGKDDLSRDDQLELCTRLPTLLAAARSVDAAHPGIAAQFCDKFVKSTPEAEQKSMSFRSAVFASAASHTAAKNYDAAEELYRQFLVVFCNVEEDPSNARNTPGCRRILTQFLPRIYHQKGDAGLLLDLVDECDLYQIERDSDLRELRQYLLTDLWTINNYDALEALSSKVLKLSVWGEFSNPSRELIPLALSAHSRSQAIRKNCFAARQAYLDYEFYHSGIDPTWLNDHVTVPARLLCRPAPAVSDNVKWLGAAPTAGKVTILQFVTIDTAANFAQIRRASEILGSVPNASVRTLIPATGRIYDPAGGEIKSGLSVDEFAAAAKSLFGSAKHAVGVLQGGRRDPTISRYGVQHYPTIVMIGPEGNVAAYHTARELDHGWASLAQALAK